MDVEEGVVCGDSDVPTPLFRSHPHILGTHILFSPPQILDAPALKSLYLLLLDLSSRAALSSSNLNDASEIFNAKFNQFNFIIEFKEIRFLSDILFKLLGERFEELFSVVDNTSATTGIYSKILETAEELILVLRCCMVILNMLISDQTLLIEKCEVLFSTLRRLCHINLSPEMKQNTWSFKKTVSTDCIDTYHHQITSVKESMFASLCFINSVDTLLSLLSTILEVFADGLLAHSTLRKYFFLINSSSSTMASEKLFACRPSQSVMGSVIEAIAANFYTSFFNEQAFEDLLNRSFWTQEKHFKTPELSLPAGLLLILDPIMLSAPKLLQAHVISLVAETVGTNMISKSVTPDQGLIDCYISAFEKSVILYTRNLSGFEVMGHLQCSRSYATKSYLYEKGFHQSFESYIHPLTRGKIDNIVTKFENSWDSSLSKLYFRNNVDLAVASIAYIKENHYLLDDLGKNEMLTMLQIITLIASEDVSNSSPPPTMSTETNPQDLCLIAAILKLMSSSLLQLLWCLKHRKITQTVNSLKDVSPCTDYVTILNIVSSCFQQFNTHLPVQRILGDLMDSHPTKHKKSKYMLLHFSGFLSLCFSTRLEFLMKGCIYTMMVSMNLIISEEGNVDAIRSLLDTPELKVYSSQLVPENAQQVQARTSSLVVASNFQKVQTVYLSSYSQKKTLTDERSENNLQEGGMETGETCNANIFLKCILQVDPDKVTSDIDDLASFVVCKQGKDYAQWLKDREKYRKFRYKKESKKKKLTWKHKNIGRT